MKRSSRKSLKLHELMVRHNCSTLPSGVILSTREILELPGQTLSMQQLSNHLSGKPHLFQREEDVMVRQVHGDASYPMAAWRAIVGNNI
jgi:hypothetical protein